MKNKVFLALGSNLGNREENLINAIKAVSDIPQTEISSISSMYETNPVGYTKQDKFLNMVIAVMTELRPIDLLRKLQEIEILFKRARKIHWGPRTIDIDILLYEDIKMDLFQLSIPHPRMLERAFVLVPLKDVYNNKKINKLNIDEMIDKCKDKDGIRLYKELNMGDI